MKRITASSMLVAAALLLSASSGLGQAPKHSAVPVDLEIPIAGKIDGRPLRLRRTGRSLGRGFCRPGVQRPDQQPTVDQSEVSHDFPGTTMRAVETNTFMVWWFNTSR